MLRVFPERIWPSLHQFQKLFPNIFVLRFLRQLVQSLTESFRGEFFVQCCPAIFYHTFQHEKRVTSRVRVRRKQLLFYCRQSVLRSVKMSIIKWEFVKFIGMPTGRRSGVSNRRVLWSCASPVPSASCW